MSDEEKKRNSELTRKYIKRPAGRVCPSACYCKVCISRREVRKKILESLEKQQKQEIPNFYFNELSSISPQEFNKIKEIIINGEDVNSKWGTIDGHPFISTKPHKKHWIKKGGGDE